MSYADVPAGKGIPDDFFTVIEIPANHSPIKYEVDNPLSRVSRRVASNALTRRRLL